MANNPRIKTLNLDDPATMARLLRTGAIWKYPQFWQDAVDAMKRGIVPLAECKDVPASVMEGFRK